MPVRVTKQRRLLKYSIGDLRDRIKIFKREISPGNFSDPRFRENYTELFELWASISTPRGGVSLFSGVTVPERTSHIFVIRFEIAVTSENRIEFEDNSYKILAVKTPEERQEYSELYSELLGDKDLAANK